MSLSPRPSSAPHAVTPCAIYLGNWLIASHQRGEWSRVISGRPEVAIDVELLNEGRLRPMHAGTRCESVVLLYMLA
jgi:hypothetical protein